MRRLTVAVIIVTRGRAAIVAECMRHIAEQTRAPDRLILSATCPEDLNGVIGGERTFGSPGIAAQRNRALDLLGNAADIAVFLDDDFAPTTSTLAAIEALFRNQPGLAGATGTVLADGIKGTPIDDATARAILAGHSPTPAAPRPVIGLYGCNMAVRLAAARGLRFDEALPLYGWQEDLDFGARLSARGAVIRSTDFGGVHRGVRAARIGQRGFGYAQIANPIYLMRGDRRPVRYLLALMLRNLAANMAGALAEQCGVRANPWIDRRGRLSGNLAALRDLLRGRIAPHRAVGL